MGPDEPVVDHVPALQGPPIAEQDVLAPRKKPRFVLPVKDSWADRDVRMQVMGARDGGRTAVCATPGPGSRAVDGTLGEQDEGRGGQLAQIRSWWEIEEETGFEVVDEGQPNMFVCGQGVKMSARLRTLSAIVGDHDQ